LSRELRLWLPALLWAGCVWLIGGSSDVPSPPVSFYGIDKVAHFCMYGLIAVLIARATRPGGSRFSPVLPLALAVTLGASDEVHQLSVLNRSSDPYDFIADVTGIATCFFVARRSFARAPSQDGPKGKVSE
jgi:VanZ family protein